MTDPAPNPQNNRNFLGSVFKALVPVIIIVALAAVGLQLVKWRLNDGKSGGHAVEELAEGSVVPDFPLQVLGGKTIQFSELGAKVVLINFWATWCEACMVEMPSIVNLRNTYHERGFEVAAINVDENPAAVVPKARQQFKIDFPIYLDPEGTLSELFDVHAIPLTIVLDKDRKILLMENGERDWMGKDVRAMMEKWLGD